MKVFCLSITPRSFSIMFYCRKLLIHSISDQAKGFEFRRSCRAVGYCSLDAVWCCAECIHHKPISDCFGMDEYIYSPVHEYLIEISLFYDLSISSNLFVRWQLLPSQLQPSIRLAFPSLNTLLLPIIQIFRHESLKRTIQVSNSPAITKN